MFFTSDPVRLFTDVGWFYFRKKNVYSVDPDKDRAHHISDNSFTDYFWKIKPELSSAYPPWTCKYCGYVYSKNGLNETVLLSAQSKC